MDTLFAILMLCALIAIGAMLPPQIKIFVGLWATLYFMGLLK